MNNVQREQCCTCNEWQGAYSDNVGYCDIRQLVTGWQSFCGDWNLQRNMQADRRPVKAA